MSLILLGLTVATITSPALVSGFVSPSYSSLPSKLPSSSIRSATNLARGRRFPLNVSTFNEEAPASPLTDLLEKEENDDFDDVGKSNALLSKIVEKVGTVDDDRIIHPEYQSGEVTRIFSSLTYSRSPATSKSEEDGSPAGVVVSSSHAAGSVFGAATLIAGTMVGAGVLALPTAVAPVGFVPSTAAMGVGWVYMVISGLLIAELSINRMGQSGKPGKGMLDLYEGSLGPSWSKVATGAYFFLHYAVFVAYLSQGGASVEHLLESSLYPLVAGGDLSSASGILPQGTGQVVFASVCASALFVASKQRTEQLNNAFVALLAASFVGIIGYGAQTADFAAVVDPARQNPAAIVDAFPIVFLSLVYHNVVPTVVNKLEGDRAKITKAIVSGTAVPAVLFLAWTAVVLGNVPADAMNEIMASSTTAVNPVAMLQEAGGDAALLGTLVGGFSFLAVATSLIGFTYALMDAWTDVFRIPREGSEFEAKWKAPLFGLIFGPPLVFAATDPDIFFKALDYGGAFGVSTLFLLLPPIMIWSQRYGDDQPELLTKPMVPFGKLSLASMWKAAATLILEQGAEKLGVFEWVSEHFEALSP